MINNLRRETADNINSVYYNTPQRGRDDYWRKMAAPRFRVKKLLTLLENFQGGRTVDLGCGDGRFLRILKGQHPQWFLCGIDLSVHQIEINKREMPGIQWEVADLCLETLPLVFPCGAFDTVVASEIIEHVPDPMQFLINARILVKPSGGKLLLSTQSGSIGETERRVGHRRHFSKREMEELLKQSGWNPIRVWSCGFPFHDWAKRAANLFPDSAMRNFSEHPYGVWQNVFCHFLRMAYRFNSSSFGTQLFAVGERSQTPP